MLEGRQHFRFGDQRVGLLTAHQVLEYGEAGPANGELPVVVLGDRNTRYGIGGGPISWGTGTGGAATGPAPGQGSEHQRRRADGGRRAGADCGCRRHGAFHRETHRGRGIGQTSAPILLKLLLGQPKRVLAVDDSLTVRELERKMLTGRGYVAEVAVDGMDGWNAVRAGDYDLVITDVDMPRMDGIELATPHQAGPALKIAARHDCLVQGPRRGPHRGDLEAGADYYLTKGSFHDETLVAGGGGFDRRSTRMRIAIVNDMIHGRGGDAAGACLRQHSRIAWVAATGMRRWNVAA